MEAGNRGHLNLLLLLSFNSVGQLNMKSKLKNCSAPGKSPVGQELASATAL